MLVVLRSPFSVLNENAALNGERRPEDAEPMHLLLVGISHRTAPVDLRERVDFQSRGIDRALAALAARGVAREAVVLSTCNRSEIYAAVEDTAAGRTDLVAFLSAFHKVDASAVTAHVHSATDLDAARHLFRVAAGLDSLVVG